MRTMLNTMCRRLTGGEALVLVTITAASGATPRGAGAHMLVGREGRICGTIGGGAVEYRSILAAQQVLEREVSDQQSFSLTRDDVQQLGMICGGFVSVFFHYIPKGDSAAIALAQEAERSFSAGEGLWLMFDLNCGGALSLYTEERGIFGRPVPDWVVDRRSRKPTLVEKDGASFCVEQINSAGRVYIFGGGHVSQELEPVLSHVGFRCVVLDDRSEFTQRALFPTAEEVRMIDFNHVADYVSIGPNDYVCIMTRGHAYDTVLQAQILKCCPCYVGVIGSRKKAAAIRQILQSEYGLTDQELNLITTPIGLDIEAETPAEIAISIAAQMIQVRAKQL